MTRGGSGEMRALVLTVGTGDMRQLEASLIRPLVKSIEDGQWQKIVLLPSLVTETFARDLRELKQDLSIEIEVLPGAGQENDADTCFGHFDAVLGVAWWRRPESNRRPAACKAAALPTELRPHSLPTSIVQEY